MTTQEYFLKNGPTLIKTQGGNNFLPFLITDTLTQEAFKKLKENEIIIGFVRVCCIKDEGRPLIIYDLQEEYIHHFLVL